MSKPSVAEQVVSFYPDSIPQHVGIIMDGNGRWAQNKGMPRVYGHKKGVDAVRESVRFARQTGIKSLTLFAFSSENWKRPEDEVSGLMELFMMVLSREVNTLHKNNVRLNIIGDVTAFSQKIQNKVADAHKLTKNNDGLTLNVAANYGGRWDIVNAAQNLAEKVKSGELEPADINESLFDDYTSMSQQPDLDLLIRTGGESRVSNFLLWQLAYAELYFTPTYWPDFDQLCFAQAVEAFAGTERRFGLTGEQIKSQTTEQE